ncbi:hypothetical protein AWU65_14140 [Paenibacillus glucanolyticus]|uniref:Uncharacterized protein n=1 Tax=Paenibacillus glucanolyticus TaxID=59843 RepID=A0A163K4D0_9BACL|nr:hypothetical protein [Paenibacillus glucanolyticus]KZS46982.1 hypothetical protein AWU65_14140 [Paenibacillus glucanolyticus]
MSKSKIKLFGLSLAATLMFTVTSSSLYADPGAQNEGLFFATSEEVNKNVAQSNIVIEKPSSDLPNLNDYSSFAYDVKEVESNPELRSFLQKALQSGEKVYLYGGLTPGKYEELLNQPLEFKVRNAVEGEVRSLFIKDVDQLHEGKQLKETTEQEIVGYSLQDTDGRMFMLNYKNMDENGNEIPTDASIILSQIVKHEERTNQITPASTVIDSNDYDIRTVGGLYGVDNAEMITQWFLYKEKNESDTKFDYFAIKDIIRINKIGGSTNSKKLTVTHDVIYTKDDFYGASPGDKNNGPYQISFAYPWSLQWSFTYDGNPNIDLTENVNTDTANWVITPDYLQNLQGTDKFELGTSWKANSTYKYTGVQVSHVSEWHSAVQHMFDLSNTFNIGYNW